MARNDVTYNIGADIAEFRRGLSDVKGLFGEMRTAGDKVSRDLSRGFRNLAGIVAGAFSVRAIVSATVKAEQSLAQLDAVLMSTGHAAGYSRDQLVAMAEELSKSSTFAKDDIIDAETRLLSYAGVAGENIPRAMQNIIDQSARLGISLTQSAETIGKALESPAKAAEALSKQGFGSFFTDETKAVLKALEATGRKADAQILIMEILEESYAGAAAASRETLGGALSALKNSFEDLLQGDGGNIKETTKAINDLADTMNSAEVKQGFQEIIQALARIGTLLAEGATEFANFGKQMAATLAGATGNLSELDRVEMKIKDVDRALNNSFLGRPLRFLFTNREDLEKTRATLVGLRDALGGKPNATSAAPGPVKRTVDTTGLNTTDPKKGKAAADRAAREALAALRNTLQGSIDLLKHFNQAALDQLDQALDDNQISFRAYADQRIALQQEIIDKEISVKRQVLDSTKDESDRAKLIQEITLLEAQRGEVAVKARQDQIKAEQGLKDELTGLRARLMEIRGDSAGAAGLRLELEFRDTLARMKAEGNTEGQAIIGQIFNAEVAKAQLDQIETQYNAGLARMALAERNVELEVQTGIISQRQGREKLIELHKKTAAEVAHMIPLMEELAHKTGDPAAIARVEALKQSHKELGIVINEINQGIRSSMEDAFAGIIDGTKSVKDAFADMAKSIMQMLSRIAAEKIVDQIFGAAMGAGGSSGGSFATLLAGLFHQGGTAGAPGPSRQIPALAFAGAPRFHRGGMAGIASDEVPAILKRGEEVLTRKDPRHRANGGGNTFNINVATPDGRLSRQTSQQMQADLMIAASRAAKRNR